MSTRMLELAEASTHQGRAEWSTLERAAWAPPSELSPSEWADRYRVLPANAFAAEPGPYSTQRTAYVREIQDAVADPDIDSVAWCKSTQIGGTEALHNVLWWQVSEYPVPVVVVMPRDKDVREVIDERFEPSVLASPELERQLAGTAHDFGTSEIAFTRCNVFVRSAQSPADLASKPAGLLLGDECDKWPGYRGKEASPWHLALERLRTFRGKSFLTSTPSWEDGLIWREFLAGDQRLYHVPCPHCGAFDAWEWEQLRWDGGDKADPERLVDTPGAAWVECAHCKGRILDAHKEAAIAAGVWVPRGASIELRDGRPFVNLPGRARRRRSYRLWAVYSPWVSFGQLVAKFLALHGEDSTDDDAQHWQNSWLGLPWKESVEAPEREGVALHIRGYERDQVPDAARCIILACDVQKLRIPYVVRAWGVLGESWLVRCGEVVGFDALEEQLLLRAWGARGMQVRVCAIDSRHRTDEVFEFARRHADRVRMIKGVQRDGVPFASSRIERHPVSGRPLKGSLKLWKPDVDFFRDRLAAHITNDAESGPHAWHLHVDVGEAYLAHLSSQEKVRPRHLRTRTARQVWRTKRGSKVHDWWDCEVYQMFAAALIGADRIPADAPTPRRRVQPTAPPASAPPADDAQRTRDEHLGRRRGPRRGGGFLDGLGGGL